MIFLLGMFVYFAGEGRTGLGGVRGGPGVGADADG